MGEYDVKIIFPSQNGEDVEEANTVRSAGNTEDERVPVFPESLFRDEVLDTTNHSPRFDGEGAIRGVVR
jgi:hypothetical protein